MNHDYPDWQFAVDHVYLDWDIVGVLWIMIILIWILYVKYDHVYPDWDLVRLLWIMLILIGIL